MSASLTQRHEATVAKDNAAQPLRLLLAEDDADMRQVLHAALTRAGYCVRTARDGSEASVALRTQSVDVVVLDVRMPGRSGIEVLRELRDRQSRIPAVVISGFADGVEDVGPAHRAVVLAKPFGIAELLGALRRASAMWSATLDFPV